jgi:hypothetical protein
MINFIFFIILFISVQTKVISTAEENQQNQASLHPALDIFTKIFAGIMQQQQQQTPTIAPITGKSWGKL